MQLVLARLKLPRPQRIVSVAGTNGKGSTVAVLESLYRSAGHRVACYTSPHVVQFNERMRVAGRPLSDAKIVSALQVVEAARGDSPLTYFEFGTLAALVAFAAEGADVYVLEIGLGGRLDAVNAIDPDGSVITNIALDHCEWLGADIESIAGEKAGVMRPGLPVAFGGTSVPAAITSTAAARDAQLLLRGREFAADYRPAESTDTWVFTYQGMAPLVLGKPSLVGAFQIDNAAAALALFFALEGPQRLTPGAISDALAQVRLAGRLQRLVTDRHWLLDVAHNPAATAVLAQELERQSLPGKLHMVIGVLADKDLEAMLQPLLPLVDTWIAVTPRGPRALPAQTLASRLAELGQCPCYIAPDIDLALQLAAQRAASDDLIAVTGSFYTVGPALEVLGPVADKSLGYTRGANGQED